MIGAIQVLEATQNPGPEFVILNNPDNNACFYSETRSARTYRLQARIDETSTPVWINIGPNVTNDYQLLDEMAPGVVHRINPSAVGTTVHMQSRRGFLNVIFEPRISVATARRISITEGDVQVVDIRDDFTIDAPNRLWTVVAANPARASATIDPDTGLVTVTGVLAIAATTVTVTVTDSFNMTVSKAITVEVVV